MKDSLFRGILIAIIGGIIMIFIEKTLIKSDIDAALIIGAGVIMGLIAWLISKNISRIRVIFKSGVIDFFPKGQEQYICELLKELRKSGSLTMICARGLDLIGERSKIGSSLIEWKRKNEWDGNVEVYLLNSKSKHLESRVDSLEMKIEKYTNQLEGVAEFLGELSQRRKIKVSTYHYDAEPVFRAVILDHCAYVCLYKPDRQGITLQCYKIHTTGCCLYEGLRRYRDYLKKVSKRRDYNKDEKSDKRNE